MPTLHSLLPKTLHKISWTTWQRVNLWKKKHILSEKIGVKVYLFCLHTADLVTDFLGLRFLFQARVMQHLVVLVTAIQSFALAGTPNRTLCQILPRKTQHTNRMRTASTAWHRKSSSDSPDLSLGKWIQLPLPRHCQRLIFQWTFCFFELPKCGRPLSLCFFAAFIGFTLRKQSHRHTTFRNLVGPRTLKSGARTCKQVKFKDLQKT